MINIRSDEIIADVKSAAWLESELHPELNRHSRHEMADICEPGNVDRVWRTLGVAEAQVRVILTKILLPQKHTPDINDLQQPEKWVFRFLFPVSNTLASFLREKIHEYMVAAVMTDRTETIIPDAALVWQHRRDDALAELRGMASIIHPPYFQVRRPLWPL